MNMAMASYVMLARSCENDGYLYRFSSEMVVPVSHDAKLVGLVIISSLHAICRIFSCRSGAK